MSSSTQDDSVPGQRGRYDHSSHGANGSFQIPPGGLTSPSFPGHFVSHNQVIPPPPQSQHAVQYAPPQYPTSMTYCYPGSVPGALSYGLPPVNYSHPHYGATKPHAAVAHTKPGFSQMLKKFALNTQVEVCISANCWVLGIIVGALKLIDKITGMGYDIRYSLSGEARTATFPETAVRLPQGH